MAAYPTTPAYKSTTRPITKRRHRVTEAGTIRGSSLLEEDAFRIEVVHPFITSSDISTLQTFYASNKDADNTITASDGDAYDCWFETDYEITVHSSVLFTAKVKLLANRQ